MVMEGTAWEQIQEQCPDVQKVDLMIGLPSFNQSSTIGSVVESTLAGLKASLSHASTLVVNVDVGSQDGTPEIVKRTVGNLLPVALVKPVTEGVSAKPFVLNRLSYSGMPGREEAFRSLFAITERLQAKACVVIDASVRSVTTEWIDLLARPVLEKGADYVAPVFRRQRYEGSLTNNLIAPLTRSLYGKRMACQTGGGYGFSGKLASFYLEKEFLWEGDAARFGIDSWLTTVAVAEGYTVWQARLGARIQDTKAGAGDLSMVIAQAVGGSLHYIEPVHAVLEKQDRATAD